MSTLRTASAFILAATSVFTTVPAAKAQSATAAPTQPIFYLLDSAGARLSLEYKIGEPGALTAFAVQGERSTVRFAADTKFKFLVVLPSGGDLQAAAVQFFQYDAKQGWRRITTRTVDKKVYLASGALVRFDSESVGGNSFALTPKASLGVGEYCLGTRKNREVYCFGVDAPTNVSETLPTKPQPITQAQPQPPGAHAMNNADVIKLVSAGLSPEVVSSSIRQASEHAFDLSVDGLIALKTNKVPDTVISAMQQSAGSPSAVAVPAASSAVLTSLPPAPAAQMATTPPVPPDLSVFYYVNAAGRLGRLEVSKADVLDDHRTLTSGVQARLEVFGAKSAVRLSDGSVSIVVKLPQRPKGFAGLMDESIVDLNQMLFRRWESTPGSRQIWFTASKLRRGQKRDPDFGEFEFTVSKLGDSFYKIAPTEPLAPGEYCIALSSASKQYCFGVDQAR